MVPIASEMVNGALSYAHQILTEPSPQGIPPEASPELIIEAINVTRAAMNGLARNNTFQKMHGSSPEQLNEAVAELARQAVGSLAQGKTKDSILSGLQRPFQPTHSLSR